MTPVPAALDQVASERLAALSRCVVPYGGFLRGRLAPGVRAVLGAQLKSTPAPGGRRPGLLRSAKEILGNFMYPMDAPRRLLRLAASGALDLEPIPVTTLPLADLPAAMRRAEEPGAPLVMT